MPTRKVYDPTDPAMMQVSEKNEYKKKKYTNQFFFSFFHTI